MDREQLIGEFQRHQRSVQSIIKSLRAITKLDINRNDNILQIKQAILRLHEAARNVKGDTLLRQLLDWLTQYEAEVKNAEEEMKKTFGTILEKELGTHGLRLSGQYPELKTDLFTIELDFDRWEAMLWYGPKQERLGKCPLSACQIVRRVLEEKKKLGSQLPEEQFCEKLREAYNRAVGTRRGESAPVIAVLVELSYLLQKHRFLQDPRREYYTSYSRADFSYDLFRVRMFQRQALVSMRIRLTTATRDQTRNRADFLWVPDDENGNGTPYSHVQFEEERT